LTICGSNVLARSRGTSISTWPVASVNAARRSPTGPRPLTEAVLDIHLDRMLARHPDLLEHVDGRVQAARALAVRLVDLPPTEIAGLVGYLAARTRIAVNTAVQAVIDALDELCDRPSDPSNA
jgi:hypothetical protein